MESCIRCLASQSPNVCCMGSSHVLARSAQLALAIREVANPPLAPAKWRRHVALRAWRRRNGSLCRSQLSPGTGEMEGAVCRLHSAVGSGELELKPNSMVGLASWWCA
ncbi:hypothetical protein PIB30_066643 [Stylosanthes scabra]|uniref:Uncharacterized protein n=1 Tax=Stylosanthes scabra TaxID=79078 RepID=A0ABU6ZL35_9FABA|nr:hypothetical protein [Stylosanthes scabra]